MRRSSTNWPLEPESFAASWRELVFRVKDPTRSIQAIAYRRGDMEAVDRIMRYDAIQAVTHEIMQTLQFRISGFTYERLFP